MPFGQVDTYRRVLVMLADRGRDLDQIAVGVGAEILELGQRWPVARGHPTVRTCPNPRFSANSGPHPIAQRGHHRTGAKCADRGNRRPGVSDPAGSWTADMGLIQTRGRAIGPVPCRVLASGITFSLRPGAILALLGPNGAGKTSLFQGACGRGC